MVKKEDELNKESYRPDSVLSHEFKTFERIVFNEINLFFESKFSPMLTLFHKNYSTQNVLLKMTEKLKHAIDKVEKVGSIFMDTRNHNLLLAKLNAYSFSFIAIKFAGTISKGKCK